MMEAIKILVTRPKRKELIKKTRYRTIEIDQISAETGKKPQEDSFFESSAESTSEGEDIRLSNFSRTRRSSRKDQNEFVT